MVAVGLLLGQGVIASAQVHALDEEIRRGSGTIEVPIDGPKKRIHEPLQVCRVRQHVGDERNSSGAAYADPQLFRRILWVLEFAGPGNPLRKNVKGAARV